MPYGLTHQLGRDAHNTINTIQNAPHGGVEAVVVEQRQGIAGVP